MNQRSEDVGPGGFLPSSVLPSPPVSSPAPSTVVSLPIPRPRPLKPHSQKESTFISHVEQKLLEISRRYQMRFNRENAPDRKGIGYGSFSEVAKDLEEVFDVIWVSGTPTLQVPFLLNLAGAAGNYLASFPIAPKRTFQLLQKLDMAFSSLLNGVDTDTGEPLPGFVGNRKVTMTEKVRLRNIVDRTRLSIARISSQDNMDEDGKITEVTDDEDEDEKSASDEDDDDDLDEDYEPLDMEIARVYERTLVDLGPDIDSVENPKTSGVTGL